MSKHVPRHDIKAARNSPGAGSDILDTKALNLAPNLNRFTITYQSKVDHYQETTDCPGITPILGTLSSI